MNRRDFIRSLFAALTTALLPLGLLTKSKPVDSIVVDWQDSLKGLAMDGPVRGDIHLFENEGHELFFPHKADQRLTYHHMTWDDLNFIDELQQAGVISIGGLSDGDMEKIHGILTEIQKIDPNYCHI